MDGLGCNEDLRCSNNLSVISRLGSRIYPISKIQVTRPGIESWVLCSENPALQIRQFQRQTVCTKVDLIWIVFSVPFLIHMLMNSFLKTHYIIMFFFLLFCKHTYFSVNSLNRCSKKDNSPSQWFSVSEVRKVKSLHFRHIWFSTFLEPEMLWYGPGAWKRRVR